MFWAVCAKYDNLHLPRYTIYLPILCTAYPYRLPIQHVSIMSLITANTNVRVPTQQLLEPFSNRYYL